MLESENKKYSTRHLSLRVPWHDNEWNGSVCKGPKFNNACLILDRIAGERDDEQEDLNAGNFIKDLDEKSWPICVEERGTFMAPFEYSKIYEHPYAKNRHFKDSHGHFAPTPFYNPPFSAAAIPFRWMMKENVEKYTKVFGLDIDMNIEPEITKKTHWVQSLKNQKELLDCFFGQLKPEKSLCFFYAKKVPFVEDFGRVIVGVGRVKNIGKPVEYKYKSKGELRGLIWDRTIEHSIRPNFEDGFILPYHKALKFAEEHPDENINLEELAVFSPEGKIDQFSYVAEHVTNDTAIEVLVACAESIKKAQGYGIGGPWNKVLKWIDHRMGEIWKMRGPCPGLGSALNALGINLGTFIAREIEDKIGENEDPWEIMDDVFTSPEKILSPYLAAQISGTFQDVWKSLSKENNKTRLQLLKLISRFELSPEQAEMIFQEDLKYEYGLKFKEREVLENPYLIFEKTIHTPEPIGFLSVDHGIFPDDIVRNKHPLPEPSILNSDLDWRRIRALIMDMLEKSAVNGDTLLSKRELIYKIRERKMDPPCELNSDILSAIEEHFDEVIEIIELQDESKAYQLKYLADMGKIIRKTVSKRKKGKKNQIDFDPRKAIDNYFGPINNKINFKLEEIARTEKSKALKEIAESRVSVLIGSAGTGKTTLLSILCKEKTIKDGGVLALAPTGKARVKLEQLIGIPGYTIAQFLHRTGRFDGETQRFKLLDKAPEYMGDTVIIDESSMLTEDMLAATLQSLIGYKRLILVGDPYQLPPIGAGRPFFDIIHFLNPEEFENPNIKLAPCYAELSVNRRQIDENTERRDIELANWFRGGQVNAGGDEVFDVIKNLESSENLKFVKWENEEDFQSVLMQVLIDELKLENDEDWANFSDATGAINGKFMLGSAVGAERWQILSPVRNWKHGVIEINRLLHNKFKFKLCNYMKNNWQKPNPMGLEEVVWGDKVINLTNRFDTKYNINYEKKPGYVANGEVGIIVGTYNNYLLKVEFSSQPGFTYGLTSRHFGKENEPPSIELAYAITVHKSQGSEFCKVILVLPKDSPLITRELIYTALTRQKKGIVILTESDPFELLKYSNDEYSETLQRFTNLFENPNQPNIDELGQKFLEKGLIHTTRKGKSVRSKSEVIIADNLDHNQINYFYEKPLEFKGVVRWPDFTIYDDDSGSVYYWEHLGMLQNPEYKRKWERKLEWYKQNNILPYPEIGDEGCLIITEDDEKGGISSKEVDELIKEIFS